MGLEETLMKRVVKVGNAVAVAQWVRTSPTRAMTGLVEHVRNELAETVERVMRVDSRAALRREPPVTETLP